MPPNSKLFLSGCRHRPSEKTAIHVRYVHPFSVATLKWGLEGATTIRSLSGAMAVFFEEPGSSNSGLPLTYFCGYYRLRASSQQTGSENFLSLKFIWVEHTKIQCFFLRMDFGGTPNFETSISSVGADFSRVFKKASV